MCSRFEIKVMTDELVRRFDLPWPPDDFGPEDFAGFTACLERDDVRPTDPLVAIQSDGRASLRRWGPPAPWDGKPMINARTETLFEKPTFRPFLDRRFLVPATAYFEWRKEGRARHRNRIECPESDLFSFAGIGNETHVIVLTIQPAPDIAHIHGRMPVILEDREAEARWLNAPLGEAVEALHSRAGLKAEEEKPRPKAQGDLFG
ncbi:MAG: SOS response-associated peptidase [Magnetovibrionaceae bacterium]